MTLSDIAEDDASQDWLVAAGETLARLQACDVDRHPLARRSDAAVVENVVRKVSWLRPQHAPRIERLGRAIMSRWPATAPVRLLHGDYDTSQLMITPRGLVVLDLDAAGMGDPLSDVAHFTSDLLAHGDPARFPDAREAFLQGYARHAPLHPGALEAHEAIQTLARALAPFRQCLPDWPERCDELITLAEQRLEDPGPH